MSALEPPTDIPWKRIGASSDMIDTTGGDLKFPEKWRSSIAVFSHEPRQKLPPDYENRKITYLKIVSTITNFQLPSSEVLAAAKQGYYGEDVSIMSRLKAVVGKFATVVPALKKFEARITDSFPCYGALLQVTVFPNSDDPVETQDYPYIVSLQPRKREMYEVVSQSGEALSQSDTKLNLASGTTSTKTVENYDLDLGYSRSAAASVGFAALGVSEEKRQVVGSVQTTQDQIQDIRTTDMSKSRAESYSYTTNINQLYTQLQSYHLGTNRAVFFMQPRPHMQDAKFTFIKGLRRIEGIQEFFLVVNRPAKIPGLCIEISLETAHLYARRAYQPRIIRYPDLLANPNYLNKTADALGIDLNTEPYKTFYRKVTRWNELVFAYRYIVSQFINAGKLSPGTGFASIGNVYSELGTECFTDVCWVSQNTPELFVEDVALIFEEYEADDGYFFVTGRQLCCCMTSTTGNADLENSDKEHISSCGDQFSIVYEEPYLGPSLGTMASEAYRQNQVISDVNRCLFSSLGSSKRIPYGEGTFLGTGFIMDGVVQLLRLLRTAKVKDLALTQIDSLKSFLKDGLGSTSKVKSVFDLCRLSTEDVMNDMNLSLAKAKKARLDILERALTGLNERDVDPKAQIPNSIVEEFSEKFPDAKLAEIIKSAGYRQPKPKAKEVEKGIAKAPP